MDLVERRRVHEVVVVAVLIEVLHLALVQRRTLHAVFRPELLVRQRAAADVPQLDPHEAPQVARRDVLQLEDPEKILVHLDEHALLQSRCLYRGHVSEVKDLGIVAYPAAAAGTRTAWLRPAPHAPPARATMRPWRSSGGIRSAICSRSSRDWTALRLAPPAGCRRLMCSRPTSSMSSRPRLPP